MRQALRVAAFFTAVGLSILAAIGAAALLGVFLTTPGAATKLASLPSHPWWFTYEADAGEAGARPRAASPLWSLAASLAAAAAALATLLRLRRAAPRAPAPIAVFLELFLLTLCLENLRAGAAYLAFTDRSLGLAVALSRTVYGGRFLGLLALFLAGIYGLEMKGTRHTLLAAGAAGVAFAVAVSIPVDRTVFLSALTHKLGDEQSLWFASLVLSILVVAAAAASALTGRRRPGSTLISAGTILALAGKELLFFAASPALLACGLALVAGACVLWVRGSREWSERNR